MRRFEDWHAEMSRAKESRRFMIKRVLRNINERFPAGGLPKPSLSLERYGLRPYFEIALSSLGAREYARVRFPYNGTSFMVTVRAGPFWRSVENRRFEPNCLEHIAKVVKEGSGILDIGAGFGAYAILFSRLARERGEIHAFEPDPVCREVLHDNVRRNRLTNVRINDVCVSSTSGTAVLKNRSWGNGNSTILDRAAWEFPLHRVVAATSIDKYCSENGFRPNGIKIDVEGAEGLVLAGALRTIEEHRPWVLLEFHNGLMTHDEKLANWHMATASAKRIIYLDGDSRIYSSGDEMDSLPECSGFHMFIEH